MDFEYHAFVGDYTAIIPDLEKAADPALNPDTVFRLRAAIILMTALAFTGREMDALHLMRRLGSQLNDSSESVGLRERFTKDAFLLLLMAGQWRWCIDILGTAAVGDSTRKSELDAAHELAIGTAYAFSGRGTEALEPLISAVAQLEIHSLQGALRGPTRQRRWPTPRRATRRWPRSTWLSISHHGAGRASRWNPSSRFVPIRRGGGSGTRTPPSS
ncbi:hypothetical protein [Arthrobacter ulcerisalmonis]|uniref:hypothetical protein n=1 Tax=Arthrobacter ulcerisalmonis TaxID=2483813 RepID=UPI003625A9BF